MPFTLKFHIEAMKNAKKRLPPDRYKQVFNALEKFMNQPPLLPALKLRQFKNIKGAFLINANKGDRILLLQLSEDVFEVFDINTHDKLEDISNRNREQITAYLADNKKS